jgi:hypothetical protein
MLFIPVTRPGLSSKLVRRWVGPFRVLKKESPKVYVLCDEEQRQVGTKVSVLRLKHYNDRKTLGAKWLTAEYDERLDHMLMEDGVVQDVARQQLQYLNDLNREGIVADDLEPEIIDFFVPHEEMEDDADGEVEVPKPKRSRVSEPVEAMDIDEGDEALPVVYDQDLSAGLGHEAEFDEQGQIRLKSRVAAWRPWQERERRLSSRLRDYVQ